MKKINPRQILGHGRFATLLRHTDFIIYCKKRGIYTNHDDLERFEKLGIFLPLLRVKYPELQRKIERTSKNTYKPLDILEEGEIWNGETVKEYAHVYFSDEEEVNAWIKEKLIYIPSKDKKTFQTWKSFLDEDGDRFVESYYSQFQILELEKVLKLFRLPYSLTNTISFGNNWNIKTFRKYFNHIKADIKEFREKENELNEIAKICQIISNRYLPFAETDSRVLIQTSIQLTPFEEEEFNFFNYCRQWNAKKVLDEMGISIKDVASAWDTLIYKSDESPIGAWRELINFVSREKRNQLKDTALLAETFYTMSKMLNLFHKDLTDEKLYTDEVSPSPEEVFRRKGVLPDDFLYKEFVVNKYGLNPKPQLILAVEGEGEFNEIPKLVKSLFGKSLADYRILIMNLNSIGEFVAKKSKTSEELRIERFIDHFHDSQTIVYFIIDDENNAKQVKNLLINKKSQHAKNRTITKEDFFKVWQTNIEFDNFTDEEIARAMTNLCESRYVFNDSEIKNCRDSFGTKELVTLSDLYKEKLNHGLKKTHLLEILFDYIKLNPKITIKGIDTIRPVIEVINKVMLLAIKNYQPTRLKRREEAQNSGWIRNSTEEKPKDS